MTPNLQKELTEKYKEFFQHLERHNTPMIDPDEPISKEIKKLHEQKSIVVPMQFGFECNDGWYVILDELMGNIKNHIWNENRNREYRIRSRFIRNIDNLRYKLPWKWKKLQDLIFWFVNKFPRGVTPMLPIEIHQIKEKFGGLCFYYYGGDNFIDGLVNFAENISYRVCEECGSTHKVGQTQRWIYTICKKCYDKADEKIKRYKWELGYKNIYQEHQEK